MTTTKCSISPNVILISGKMGSGKTTLANALRLKLIEAGKDVEILLFAGVIYEIHNAALSILKKYGITRPIVKDGPLLQLLGTEWGRKTIDDNIWVTALKGEVQHKLSQSDNPENLFFLVPDCRFKNEFEAFPDALRIRLECDRDLRKGRCEMWRDRDDHISETDLDEYAKTGRFNLKFHTDRSTVAECVEQVMRTLNLKVSSASA